MKKIAPLLISTVFIFLAGAGAQSLAEIASQTRAKQKANPSLKVIDNDVLSPKNSPDSDVTAPTKPDEPTPSTGPDDKAQSAPDDKKKTAEDQQKKIDDWKKKIADQKKEIVQLQRELDVAERETRLRAAAYYADAGVQLRNQAQFAEDSRKSQEEIDSKKQAIEAAKQKLDEMEEQARKDGVPGNQLD